MSWIIRGRKGIKPPQFYKDIKVPLEDLLKAIDHEEMYLLELSERSIDWKSKLKSYQFLTTFYKSQWRLARLKATLHARLREKHYNECLECSRILKKIMSVK